MARISLSEVLQNIAGSVGEHTFACWKGVNYLRQKAVTISNPCSSAQALTRSYMTALGRSWHRDMTDVQRAQWEEFAKGLKSASEQVGPNGNGGAGTFQVIPDGGGVMSGFNAFLKVNIQALSAGMPSPPAPAFFAPLGEAPPNAPTVLGCVYCFAAPDSIIRIGWTDPLDAPEDARIRIWLLSLDASVHRQIIASVALAVETYDIGSVHVALGAITDVSNMPGHYVIQVDCISAHGLKSPPSNICQVEVTTAVPGACGVL